MSPNLRCTFKPPSLPSTQNNPLLILASGDLSSLSCWEMVTWWVLADCPAMSFGLLTYLSIWQINIRNTNQLMGDDHLVSVCPESPCGGRLDSSVCSTSCHNTVFVNCHCLVLLTCHVNEDRQRRNTWGLLKYGTSQDALENTPLLSAVYGFSIGCNVSRHMESPSWTYIRY